MALAAIEVVEDRTAESRCNEGFLKVEIRCLYRLVLEALHPGLRCLEEGGVVGEREALVRVASQVVDLDANGVGADIGQIANDLEIDSSRGSPALTLDESGDASSAFASRTTASTSSARSFAWEAKFSAPPPAVAAPSPAAGPAAGSEIISWKEASRSSGGKTSERAARSAEIPLVIRGPSAAASSREKGRTCSGSRESD